MIKARLDMIHWEARLLIEACRVLEERWTKIADTTEDEDEQADYLNDLGQLELVKEHLEEVATEAFGPGIKKFSRDKVS